MHADLLYTLFSTFLQISNTRPEEISFRIHQATKLGRLQPAAVSVYEYYDRESTVKTCAMSDEHILTLHFTLNA